MSERNCILIVHWADGNTTQYFVSANKPDVVLGRKGTILEAFMADNQGGRFQVKTATTVYSPTEHHKLIMGFDGLDWLQGIAPRVVKRYPHECPCGILASMCTYHSEVA